MDIDQILLLCLIDEVESEMAKLVVVMAFKRNEDGELLAAMEPLQATSEGAAISRAKLLAADHDGVLAWSREADPAIGEYGEAVELFRSGEIPDID